ncbi:MAG: cbb3-type cytochrome c oxidase subunit I [Verrucomicrobiales bacterium]|nr:cbb3-type cytochrome c oxidase subunit I [Verrucomicrobiales bacterium]
MASSDWTIKPAPSTSEVDASLRWVVFTLTAKSALWLVVGSFLTLLASVKLHAPAMMSTASWLTYGRLLPAGWSALVYGFLGQAGVAVGLWLLARTCVQKLQTPLLVVLGGCLWNLGVLAGVIGILAGHSTGREWLEMPAGAMAVLVLGAGVIGTAGWVTYSARTESSPYPSAWFVLLALLAFVWFGTVALMMLGGEGARGVVQVLVQRWFAEGLLKLWLGALGLAVILHELPTLVNRPLASRQLALVGFWALVFFAPWGATGHGDPVPRWLVSAGIAGKTLATVGVLAIGLNLLKTLEGAWGTLFGTLRGRLIGVAALSYVGGGMLQFLGSLRSVSSVVGLTWFHAGLEWLLVGGGVMLAVIAVLPETFERATGRALAPGLISAHAWLTMVGVILVAIPLLLAGVVQGSALAKVAGTYMESLQGSMHFVRLSSLGFTLFFIGQFALLAGVLNVGREMLMDFVGIAKGWAAVPGDRKGVGARS